MMRGYQIEQGVVTNVVVVPDDAIQNASGLSWSDGGLANGDGKTWILSEAGGIGWSLVDGALVAPSVEPASVDLATINDELAAAARTLRDKLLRDTDWVVIRSLETGTPVINEMTAYRQALRDVPEQESFPDNITWPEAPQ